MIVLSLSSLPSASFDPVEFYRLARKLYAWPEQAISEEAVYRAVIGRSYYSALLCAREHSGIKSSGAGIHEEVINFFKKTKKQASISNRLRGLKNLRNKADYELNGAVQKREAGESLRLAKKLLQELNYLS